jgi:hypothetical protein
LISGALVSGGGATAGQLHTGLTSSVSVGFTLSLLQAVSAVAKNKLKRRKLDFLKNCINVKLWA